MRKSKVKDPATVDPTKLAFIFRDVSCTIPANYNLALWLRYMFNNHKDDLHFLFRESQAYVNFGGGSGYSWARWCTRLNNNVTRAIEEFESGK